MIRLLPAAALVLATLPAVLPAADPETGLVARGDGASSYRYTIPQVARLGDGRLTLLVGAGDVGTEHPHLVEDAGAARECGDGVGATLGPGCHGSVVQVAQAGFLGKL